jgi:hypothetical protein
MIDGMKTHFPPRPDGRAAELDPATFDYAEEWQFEQNARAGCWFARIIIALLAASVVGGVWAAISYL